jgi:aerobic-type carbon monoxide dehydrogenase small subunit (CoxS/CutS family)
MSQPKDSSRKGISRRGFLKTVGGGLAGTAALTTGVLGSEAAARILGPDVEILTGVVPITLRVNGQARHLKVEPRTTLASALRNHLGLTGTKIVCDRGECGGCTVLADGKPIYSCMTLAVDVQGAEITTVEGVSNGDDLHPIQKAFVEKDALMCGFCTPGFVVTLKAMLDQNPQPSPDEIRQAVAGNVCRCGTYPRVFEAALEAAKDATVLKRGG